MFDQIVQVVRGKTGTHIRVALPGRRPFRLTPKGLDRLIALLVRAQREIRGRR